jgi:hypothetical protein
MKILDCLVILAAEAKLTAAESELAAAQQAYRNGLLSADLKAARTARHQVIAAVAARNMANARLLPCRRGSQRSVSGKQKRAALGTTRNRKLAPSLRGSLKPNIRNSSRGYLTTWPCSRNWRSACTRRKP